MNHKKELRILDQAPHPLRSERFYEFENKWYFMARDYQDQGPFNSKKDAIKGLEHFLAKINGNEQDVITNLKILPDIIG